MLYDKVIFVCRDNICQSPAAVTILNSIKKDEWLEVSSRGLVVLFFRALQYENTLVIKKSWNNYG